MADRRDLQRAFSEVINVTVSRRLRELIAIEQASNSTAELVSKESLERELGQDDGISQHERLFWIVIFGLMVLVAAGGNMMVIYIVSTNKKMKSVTNYFLVNLSLADTMVSTLNVIFNTIAMLTR